MPSDPVERKLVAILSADVVGYSCLMAEDEAATVRSLTAYRDEITLLVQQHRGRVVDSTGDITMGFRLFDAIFIIQFFDQFIKHVCLLQVQIEPFICAYPDRIVLTKVNFVKIDKIYQDYLNN